MSALADGTAAWVLARATGVVALALLSLAVVLGATSAARRVPAGTPRALVVAVHRGAALVAVLLVAVHVTAVVLDPQAGVGLLGALVPLTSSYRPVLVGLGTLALWLLAATTATSLLRTRLPLRAWRAVHLASWALWPLALAHGLGAGSDAGSAWVRAVAATCAAAVVAAAVVRLVGRRARTAPWRQLAPSPPGSTTTPSTRPAHHLVEQR